MTFTLCASFGLTLAAAGCGSSTSESANPRTAADGGAQTESDGATTAVSDDGGGSGTYWFITTDDFKVGIGDLSGNASFTDTLTEKPIKLALGGGSAWVLTEAGNVVRYDLGTHAKVATIVAAKTPSFLVYASGAVWVTDDDDGSGCDDPSPGNNKLVKIDPATNAVAIKTAITATADKACNRFDSLATDGTNVYALIENDFGIARIDPATSTVAAKLALGVGAGFGTGYAVATSEAVWVHNTNAKTLQKLDPTTLVAASSTPITADFLGEHMVATADAIYLDQPANQTLRIDAKTPATQTAVTTSDNSPDVMVVRGGLLYQGFSDTTESEILSYDPTTLAPEGKTMGLVFPNDLVFTD